MQVFESGVGDCGEIFRRVPADQTAGGFGVQRKVRGAVACLGGKRDALSKGGQVCGSSDSQRLDCGAFAAAGVRASQTNSTPQIVASRKRKSIDRTRDCRNVRTLYKPDA